MSNTRRHHTTSSNPPALTGPEVAHISMSPVARFSMSLDKVWQIAELPDANGLITIGVAARHIKVTKTGFRVALPLPAEWVERYQLGGVNGEQRLAELRRRYVPKFGNEEGQPFDPERDLVKRCDNNERLGAVCRTAAARRAAAGLWGGG